MGVSYKTTTNPENLDIEKLTKKLWTYNAAFIGKYSSTQILVQLYENNTYLGGGYAVIKLGWLHIDLLWVEKNYRGHGYGKQILSKLEQYALESHNIKFSKLHTGNFQGSMEFYKHLGYEIFAELEIYPENARKMAKPYIDYYMKKTID